MRDLSSLFIPVCRKWLWCFKTNTWISLLFQPQFFCVRSNPQTTSLQQQTEGLAPQEREFWTTVRHPSPTSESQWKSYLMVHVQNVDYPLDYVCEGTRQPVNSVMIPRPAGVERALAHTRNTQTTLIVCSDFLTFQNLPKWRRVKNRQLFSDTRRSA